MVGSAFRILVGWVLENINTSTMKKTEGDTPLVGIVFIYLFVSSSIMLKRVQFKGAMQIFTLKVFYGLIAISKPSFHLLMGPPPFKKNKIK